MSDTVDTASRLPDDRELLPVATGADTRAAVRRLLRPHRWRAVVTVAVLVAGSAVALLVAPLLGRIVDIVVSGSGSAAVVGPAVLIAVVAVVAGLLTTVGMSLLVGLGERLLARLREQFVDRALALPLEQVERAGGGDLTARVTGDVAVVGEAVRGAVPKLARAGMTIVLTLLAMGALDWRFLAVALLAVPIQIHTARWYVRNAGPVYARQRVAEGGLQQQLLDTVGGAATVRAFLLADDHVDRVRGRSLTAVDLVLRGIRLMTRFYARLNLAEFVGLAAVLVTGFLLVGNGSVTAGTATAAALYFHSLFGPISSALVTIDEALSAGASLARIVGVAELPTPNEPEKRALPVDGSVKVVDVHHAYRANRPVLHGVDLDIGAAERVALVGASGAGKTTLAKLIAGVHRPSGGSISLGGVGIDELGPELARQTVVLVTQEVHVFAGTLADDLRLARPDATEAQLREALAIVDALEWADALPDGLATTVGEGAHSLSVTQAQQLALARLALADPPVAILDEATAEAGSAGARVLEAAATRALAGRTGLMVAHRMTQAATADRVVVLDAGRVVEIGRHDELVASGGRYAALWEAWSATRT
ncbi:multidrug ABC transporter permease [Pseudonocardia sulfidoxydans NBRC 16205]|uniref:Multidrug ABC transporter permease n=1 Tax=Pseudonocardia sulfidoxydans NBRC 16205 TaxID=1223511 RepID=A0A511DK18_9PSEU|nr:ABC transporter ATP-binding protein [Pseudonocardia sulfidoxydans]GEL25169.1 multidrug ABC transporter permease [Pseudonocardia sulfidoxydans NBRC 16205]